VLAALVYNGVLCADEVAVRGFATCRFALGRPGGEASLADTSALLRRGFFNFLTSVFLIG
jgi:hypothetical protein